MQFGPQMDYGGLRSREVVPPTLTLPHKGEGTKDNPSTLMGEGTIENPFLLDGGGN